jgi:putative transposase
MSLTYVKDSSKPGQSALRRGRFSQENARYFLTLCTFNRMPILYEDGVPELIFHFLTDTGNDFDLVASVLMPDHLHCVLKLIDKNLSSSVRIFKGRSAITINRHLKRSGTFWQKGYFDHKFRHDEDLGPILRYLWNNPDVPGTHFRCNKEDWVWFNSTVTQDVDYPSWLKGYPME